MSIPSKRKLWSVLTYDLKTAIDVCGLPCLIKTPSRIKSDDLSLPLRTKIKIETEQVIYTAHARVLDFSDPDWIIRTKGSDFYHDRAQFVGCELLIPLSYPGLLQLCQNKKRKTYFNISEVAEDFPRLVRVEQEVACVSPGQEKIQVLRKGTLLRLDRLTKSTKMIRGISETFLMFFEAGTGKEYGFPLLAAVHFTEVDDTFKYTLQEIIDQLPLPRRVQYVAVNPYDIVVVDDEEALELMTILSGPIEIIGIRRLEILVGLYLNKETDKFEMVVIPKDDSLAAKIYVHIPSSCLVENDKAFATREIPLEANRDLLKDKFYAFFAEDVLPVSLKNEVMAEDYDLSDISLAPPLPPRRYESFSLTTAQSDPQINDPDSYGMGRKKFRSLGDIRRNGRKREDNEENHGTRSVFGTISRRLRGRHTQETADIQPEMTRDMLLKRVTSLKQCLRLQNSRHKTSAPYETFVCYLNNSEDLCSADVFPKESSKSVSDAEQDTNSEATVHDTSKNELIYLDDNLSLNTVACKVDNGRNEICYASVLWKSNDHGFVEVKRRFCCDICKTNFLLDDGNKEGDGRTLPLKEDLMT